MIPVFVGQDEELVAVLRSAFDLALPDPDVVVVQSARSFIVGVPVTPRGDAGVSVLFTYIGRDDVHVQPLMVSSDLSARWRRPDWPTQTVINAFESFLFRRVMPTAGRTH